MKDTLFQAYKFIDKRTQRTLYHFLLPISDDIDILAKLEERRLRLSSEKNVPEKYISIVGSDRFPELDKGVTLGMYKFPKFVAPSSEYKI